MSDNEQPRIYPADGTPSVAPDTKAWAEHSEEQEQTNRSGINVARDAIRRGGAEAPSELPEDIQTQAEQTPADE